MSIAEKLASERRGRLAAERLLELKQAELYAANRKLGLHARALSKKVVETQAQVEVVSEENRRVKSDLSVAHEKVAIAERRLWHSIQTIEDGFAFFDSDDNLIAANDAYLVVFDGLDEVRPGIAYARILQLLTEEGIVDTGDMSGSEWRAWMQQRRHSSNPENAVIRLWNGQYIKLIDQRGPAGDVVTLGLNITDTVRYEKELRDARYNAEEAMRAKAAFLANMSHEIRTPMNGVVGMAELLEETALSEEQQLYVDTIRNSGEALLVIINDILDFSKMEAGKMVLNAVEFDLEQTIQEVLMLVQPAADEKGLRLLLDYDLFLARKFCGDMGRIRQILTNLIGNAVKFTLDGHVVVRVTGVPDAETGQARVHVAIEDTGIGIPADKLPSMFAEFTQVEDERNRKFEGTGLGLAISKKLVDLMQGEIWATSDEGVGSCFGFRIPLDMRGEDALAMPDPARTRKRAIVIDPNEKCRTILCSQLVTLGMTATGFDTRGAAQADFDDTVGLVISAPDPEDPAAEALASSLRSQGAEAAIVMLVPNTRAAMSAFDGHVTGRLKSPVTRDQLLQVLAGLPEADVDPVKEQEEEPVPMFRARSRSAPLPASMPVQSAPAANDTPAPRAGEDRPEAAPLDPPGDMTPETAPEAVTAEDGDTSPPDGETMPMRKMRILAAEDNKTNQLVFRKLVKNLDIDLHFANNGEEAVAAYQSFTPDLVFMDISMPIMDGKQATGEIRKIEAETSRHVPIVALTAHAMDGDDAGILAAGLDEYLTKPLRKPAIFDAIARHCPDEASNPVPAETD